MTTSRAGMPESHRAQHPRPAVVVAVLVCLGLLAGAPAPPAADLSTFTQVHSGLTSDYATCQLKLTYQGGQTKRRSTLAGVSSVRPGGFDLAAFDPFQHHGSYGNDTFVGDTLVVSSAELQALLDGIALHPAMQDTIPPSLPHVSLMVLRDSGGSPMCWEHITGSYEEGDTLLQLLHDALAAPADQATVDKFRHHLVGIRR
ncbi:MAG: hypothetical protein HZB25_04590 [Candidatus Eisenbacteria bacterium]|nr:hypothetical protein [Candidatus Eisenbacteria bacterium]